MATLQPYAKYNAVAYDYTTALPDGWQLLPNIAIFQTCFKQTELLF